MSSSVRRLLSVPLRFLPAALAAALLVHPLGAQTLEVIPDTTRVTVGDPVTLRIVPRLGPGAAILGRAALPEGDLPEGFRILSSDSLATSAAGLEGKMRVAFFRPGKQSVPRLALAYRSAPGAAPDTLRSAPVAIEVVAVLPAGEQAMRDIKDLAPVPRASRLILWLALLALAALAGFFLVRRLRRKRPAYVTAPVAPAPVVPDARSPYERALERLAELERARLPERGELARHFELAADVLRRYLEESAVVPALELTTAELEGTLPPPLAADGLGERGLELLEEADLVKFARLRPGGDAPGRFLRQVRAVLDPWHAALTSTASVPDRAAASVAESAAPVPEGPRPGLSVTPPATGTDGGPPSSASPAGVDLSSPRQTPGEETAAPAVGPVPTWRDPEEFAPPGSGPRPSRES